MTPEVAPKNQIEQNYAPYALEKQKTNSIGLRTKLGRIAATGALLLGSTLAVTTVEGVTSPAAAYADTGGYPWASATELVSYYNYGYATCPDSDLGCKNYPEMVYTLGGTNYGEADPWGYELRNCTSYVAWKENSEGAPSSKLIGLGNAGQWYSSAPAGERSLAPQAGDAAVDPNISPPYGHVAYIESVNSIDQSDPGNDNITISEFNYSTPGGYDTRTGGAAALGFTEFVNFGASPTISTAEAGFTGDWNGDGITSVAGAKNDSGAMQWYLSDQLNGNYADNIFHFGSNGDIPVAGDWNGDGDTSVGIVRNDNGALHWYLTNYNEENAPVNYNFDFGAAGDIPVTGDWNNSGHSEIGVVRQTAAGLEWFLRDNLSSGSPDMIFYYGAVGDAPVTGDWNGDGLTTPGVVRNVGNSLTWYLSDSNSGVDADNVFDFGAPGDIPVTGDWNGDGRTSVGIVRKDATGPDWMLTNYNQDSAPVNYGPFYYGSNDMTP